MLYREINAVCSEILTLTSMQHWWSDTEFSVSKVRWCALCYAAEWHCMADGDTARDTSSSLPTKPTNTLAEWDAEIH
jgi:hypothetical protein